MDDRRFDELSRVLGAGISRRGALAGLAALGSVAGVQELAAKGRRGREAVASKKKCQADSPPGQCCKKSGACKCKAPTFAPTADPAENGRLLQAAIDAAPAGGGVNIAPGTYDAPGWQEDDGWHIAFMVEKPLALARCGEGTVTLRGGVGAPATADEVWSAAVVGRWQTGTVQLRGLTLVSGGPGVLNTGADLRGSGASAAGQVIDCVVEDNDDTGMILSGGAFTISRTQVRDNVDTRWCGGGVSVQPAPVIGTTVTIIDSVIDGNATWSDPGLSWAGNGGGVCAPAGADDAGAVTVILRNTKVTGNVAGPENAADPGGNVYGSGGGVFVFNQSLVLEQGTHVEGNTARAGAYCESPDPASCITVSATGGGLELLRNAAVAMAGQMRVAISSDSRVQRNEAAPWQGELGLGGGIHARFDPEDVNADIASGTVIDNDPDNCDGPIDCGAGMGSAGSARRDRGSRAPAGGPPRLPGRR